MFRIDYNGNHKNPVKVNDFVPKRFYKYVAKEFYNEHHIHYHIQGYKQLAWAIPLLDDNFEIKTIDNNINDIIILFAKTINVETIININSLLL